VAAAAASSPCPPRPTGSRPPSPRRSRVRFLGFWGFFWGGGRVETEVHRGTLGWFPLGCCGFLMPVFKRPV
jgi:hypothetical protein